MQRTISTLDGTYYEVAVERPDGTRQLVAYSGQHSRHGLHVVLQRECFRQFDGNYIRYGARAADGIIIETPDGVRILRLFFSGRTEREAVHSHTELPDFA